MARNQRIQFSLTPDLVDRVDDIPNGEKSREVRQALREYFDMD